MKRHAEILIVDDDADVADGYREYLANLGHDVSAVGSVGACEIHLASRNVDLIVLDLNMPGEKGLDYLRRLRSTNDVPVLIMTGNSDIFDRVVGLELGADDFIVKPIDPQELAARISGLLDRFGLQRRMSVRLERVTVDFTAARLLWPAGRTERLGPGEVALLRYLVSHPRELLSRETLMDEAPADSLDVNDRSIDTRIGRLRRKLETDAIVTVRGRGYMFIPPHGDG